jgi:L-fuconolactonase
MLPIIDTHQHLWDLSRFSLPWTDGVEALKRSFLPSDYASATDGCGVERSVYMEVDMAVEQIGDEVDYVGGLCADADNPMVAAVVGGRPADPDFSAWVEQLRGQSHVRGVRQILHADAPQGTCLQADYVSGVRRLGEAGLSFDVCLRPAELADAVALADRCPDTLLILDHCGNADPYVVASGTEGGEGPFAHSAAQWQDGISALGERANAVCKISGIVARVTDGWTAETLAPTVDHCLDAFPADRVVFGGDWPVCTLGASYGEWAQALRQIIASRPEADQRALLHDNAARLYRLD